jgi:hypothetical protein
MDVSLVSWFMILLALFGANVPFINERLFAIFPLTLQVKPIWLRLIELLVLYGITGVIAHFLESNIGSVFAQGWEFFAVTGCLFLVFAYPGFVMRYLRKRHR